MEGYPKFTKLITGVNYLGMNLPLFLRKFFFMKNQIYLQLLTFYPIYELSIMFIRLITNTIIKNSSRK